MSFYHWGVALFVAELPILSLLLGPRKLVEPLLDRAWWTPIPPFVVLVVGTLDTIRQHWCW